MRRDGTDYGGELRMTNRDNSCQPWKTVPPWDHPFQDSEMFVAPIGVDEKACRNPIYLEGTNRTLFMVNIMSA